jgi:hypothetical protein
MDARSPRPGNHGAGSWPIQTKKGQAFSKQQPTAGKESHRSIADNDLREMGGSTRCKQPLRSPLNLNIGVNAYRQGAKIELTVWPERHFVNRELIGGDYAETSQGKRVPKPL